MGRSAARGFTYIGLLIAIAIMGVALAAIGEVWRTVNQREKERELLFVGNQLRNAIGAYYEFTPGPAKKYPRSLEELLLDDRYPTVKRYLRKVYPDPMTDKTQWGLIKAPDGGIRGVYSLSGEKPIKTANFDAPNAGFVSASKYSDWNFIYAPRQPTAPAAPASAGARPPTR